MCSYARVHTTLGYKLTHVCIPHSGTSMCTPHSGTNSRTCAHTWVQTHAHVHTALQYKLTHLFFPDPTPTLLRQIFYVVFQAQPHTPGSTSMWQLIPHYATPGFFTYQSCLRTWLLQACRFISFISLYFTIHLEFHRQSFAIQTNSLSTHIYNI